MPLPPLRPLGGKPAASVISTEERTAAEAVFQAVDLNKDGQVQKDELKAALWKLAAPSDGDGGTEEMFTAFEAFINREFATADRDLSGALTLDEFLTIYQTIKAGVGRAERLRAAFRHFDANNDGMLTVPELARILSNPLGNSPLPQEAATAEAERIIKRFDTNGDGVLSYNEFVGWMCTKQLT
ncbi:hypothetical protein AB1Y20_002924 [Prymnesium parvum]|uniref:EF-hand domain-containing protein n=1 Tax=Prymnesium parvum TaxID=97485 RepID=A0AB34JAR0_PRYPA